MTKQDIPHSKGITAWITFIIWIVAALICIICIAIWEDTIYREENTDVRVGGIELGMDSLKAVRNIQTRADNMKLAYPMWNRGDSIGYGKNEKHECFYVKLKEGKVYEIYFHSDSLKESDVKICHGGRIYNGHSPIKYKGSGFYANYNGNGTFVVSRFQN